MTIEEMITDTTKSPHGVEAPVIEENWRDDGREVEEEAVVVEAAT